MISVAPPTPFATDDLPDTLWTCYREFVDGHLRDLAEIAGPDRLRRLRGEFYVAIVDRIARCVDRVERERDPRRRSRMISALIATCRRPGRP